MEIIHDALCSNGPVALLWLRVLPHKLKGRHNSMSAAVLGSHVLVLAWPNAGVSTATGLLSKHSPFQGLFRISSPGKWYQTLTSIHYLPWFLLQMKINHYLGFLQCTAPSLNHRPWSLHAFKTSPTWETCLLLSCLPTQGAAAVCSGVQLLCTDPEEILSTFVFLNQLCSWFPNTV